MTKFIFNTIHSKCIPHNKPQFNCADFNWEVSSLNGLAENNVYKYNDILMIKYL